MPLHTGHAPITALKEPRAPTGATRGAETGTACWAKKQQPSAGQAPQRWLGPARPLTHPAKSCPHTHPQHDACQGTTRRPHPHRRGQGGPPLPAPPHALRTRHRQQQLENWGRWERETTPPLGLRHLRQPGALQGHHRGPGATHSARPGGEQRGMGTALPTTGRAAHPAGSQERQARVSAASEDPTPTGTLRQEPWESGVGPEPTLPRTLPPTHPPRQRVAEEEERGTRGQSEKSGPIHHECPSLVRHGLGPAQENTTSPHRSAKSVPKEAPRGETRSEDTDQKDLLSASPAPLGPRARTAGQPRENA